MKQCGPSPEGERIRGKAVLRFNSLWFEHFDPEQSDVQAHGVWILRVQRKQRELFAADHTFHDLQKRTVSSSLACTHTRMRTSNFFTCNERAVGGRNGAIAAKPASDLNAFLLIVWGWQQQRDGDSLVVNVSWSMTMIGGAPAVSPTIAA